MAMKIALFALVLCSLAACSAATGDGALPEGGGGGLAVWGWGEFNRSAVEAARRRYAEINPGVGVEYADMSQNEIISKLNIAFMAREYGELPDIALIEDYSVQSFLNRFPGELRPMPESVSESDFMEYKIRALTYDGAVYGVPFDSGAAALFYRSDFIAEAGYSKGDMDDLTWDRYIEIGKGVKEKTGRAMLAMAPGEIEQIRMMMQSAGKWYVGDDGKTAYLAGNDALKAAIRIYVELIDSGIALQTADYTYKAEDLRQGLVATMPAGCWRARLPLSISEQSGKWAVAKIPRMQDCGSVNYSSIGGSSWHIIDKSPGAGLAEDFLSKTFGRDLEMMDELAGEANAVSTLKSAGELPNYMREEEFFGGQRILKEFFDWSMKVPPISYGTRTFAIEEIVKEAVQSIIQGADMDAALMIAQVKAEAVQ
jgi:lactose/L-arabinose transport system substrate-binding protein